MFKGLNLLTWGLAKAKMLSENSPDCCSLKLADALGIKDALNEC